MDGGKGAGIPPSERSDEELMELVQQGDRQAYRALFDRYQAPVWTFLKRRGGDDESSSEIFQETFLKVWRAAGTYRKGQRVKPWIYRIAVNASRDRYRSSTREVDTAAYDPDFTAGRLARPVEHLHLQRAIEALPDNLREAFLLGAVSGLDHNELAAALDISPANARARVSRARARLRSALADS